jgi:hypothetical protein
MGNGHGTTSGLQQQQQQHQRKDDQTAAGCEPRYQSAAVNVYTSFSVADAPHGRRHLVGRDAMFDVTELVRGELRVADPTVASLSDSSSSSGGQSGDSAATNVVVVEGLHPGRTEIQVQSSLVSADGCNQTRAFFTLPAPNQNSTAT